MRTIVLPILALGLLLLNSTKLWSNDLDEAESVYFDHRVNFFDMSIITNNYLCSTAMKDNLPEWETADIYKPYIREALLRGFNKTKCSQITRKYRDTKN